MAKRLPIDNTPPQVREFLKQLDVEKAEYVLEIEGKPVAGVVSPRQVEQITRRREQILALLRQSWKRNRAVQDEGLNQAVTEAIQNVRQPRTSGRSF
jgi:hypothetical protein